MQENLVAEGDLTSTGGRVMRATSAQYDEDRPLALDGDFATCGNCKGEWRILGSVSDWTEDGKSMVKNLDRVNCPCGKNRVYARPKAGYWVSDESSLAAGRAIASYAVDRTAYDQSFLLRDQKSGRPLAGVPYRIVTADGASTEHRTDSSGRTVRISGAQADSLTLHILEDITPVNADWDNDL
jgi:hypothetical protein